MKEAETDCDVRDGKHVRIAFFIPIKTGGLLVTQHFHISGDAMFLQ